MHPDHERSRDRDARVTVSSAKAIEVVARHFWATWERGGNGAPDAYLTIAGRRIAVDVTSIARQDAPTMPRLRFDKVVLRLVRGLQRALGASVPDGQAVIVTVTAPIRLPAKTMAALEETILAGLSRRSSRVNVTATIHGNLVRVRVVKGASTRTPKVIGFVHNPDRDPRVLLRMTEALIRLAAAADERPPRTPARDRWLVIADASTHPQIETYRHLSAQLGLPGTFGRILMVLAGGRVEALTG